MKNFIAFSTHKFVITSKKLITMKKYSFVTGVQAINLQDYFILKLIKKALHLSICITIANRPFAKANDDKLLQTDNEIRQNGFISSLSFLYENNNLLTIAWV